MAKQVMACPGRQQQSLAYCHSHLALAEVCGAVRAAVRRVWRLVGAHAQHATLPHTSVGVYLVSIAWSSVHALGFSRSYF